MNKTRYMVDFLRDFLIACVCLLIVIALLMGGSFIKSFNLSILWQVMLIASAFVFFKLAFVNKYGLEKKSQAINFLVFSIPADIMVILWMYLYSPSKVLNPTLIGIYIIVILIVKAIVYAMMLSDNKKHA